MSLFASAHSSHWPSFVFTEIHLNVIMIAYLFLTKLINVITDYKCQHVIVGSFISALSKEQSNFNSYSCINHLGRDYTDLLAS